MINRLLIYAVSALCLQMTTDAYAQEQPVLSENYADADTYAIFIGRITHSKLVRINRDDYFEAADYAVKISVMRKIRGNNFSLKKLTATLNIVDIDYVKTRNIVFVVEKGAPWKIIFWKQLSDVVCLDEKRIESDGWAAIASDKLTDNCVAL